MAISRIGGTTTQPSTGGIPRINIGSPLQRQAPTVEPIRVTEPVKEGGFIKGAVKFLARTAVNFADLITGYLDFATNFIVDNPIFNVGERVAVKTLEKVAPEKARRQKEILKKWKDIYKTTAEKPKLAVDRIQQAEYLQPSKEWTEAPLKTKLTKYLGETLAILGPNIIPSFLLYATNPLLGVSVTVGSTANDVRVSAIENGVPEEKAELLGLGTGILVGALDRIVPDELFSPAQKSKFISEFAKRIIPLALKEAGTEIAQENLQIAAEATFREDLGWDEIKTRNAMAGLGGLLGGAGATTVVGTINQAFSQDILLEGKVEPEVKEKVEKPKEVVKVKPEVKVEVPKAKEVVKAKPVEKPTAIPKEVKPAKKVGRGVVAEARKVTPPIVGEGRGVSKVGISIEAKAIAKSLTKSFEGTAEYTPVVIKEQAKLAANLIKSDIEKAKRVVLGQEDLPGKLRAGTIIKAMEDYAIKSEDIDLLRSIANSPLVSETSLHAQELRLLAERDPHSPVTVMRDIVKTRKEAFKKRFKGRTAEQVQKNVVQDIRKTMKSPNKSDWNSFLNSIEC